MRQRSGSGVTDDDKVDGSAERDVDVASENGDDGDSDGAFSDGRGEGDDAGPAAAPAAPAGGARGTGGRWHIRMQLKKKNVGSENSGKCHVCGKWGHNAGFMVSAPVRLCACAPVRLCAGVCTRVRTGRPLTDGAVGCHAIVLGAGFRVR